MRLSELLAGQRAVRRVPGSPDPEAIAVTALTADSRQVAAGSLFAALPGAHHHGAAFVGEAVKAGAAAILLPADTDPGAIELPTCAVAVLEAQHPRAALAHLAAAFYGRQPARLVAVTGTNGKTSTTGFVRQLNAALGRPAAALGTLGLTLPAGMEAAPIRDPGKLTTPDPAALHATLADLAAAGIEDVAIEASSHGLDQERLDGLQLAAGAYLNLSHDHLDYHGTLTAYFNAKARLLRELLAPGAPVVVNADISEYPRLAEIAHQRGLALWPFGRAAKRLHLAGITPGQAHLDLALTIDGQPFRQRLPVVGAFQAMNALAALGLVLGQGGVATDAAIEALGALSAPPGRLEHVATAPSGAPVFVDFAHSPGGLETMLAALRPHIAGRLVTIIGCGGDRDPQKRPIMGEIAQQHSDLVIVTDDNPRSEDPAEIRRAVLAGCPEGRDIGDRRAAIAAGVAELGAADGLVIAGKGHERTQIISGTAYPFDDGAEARRAVTALTAEGA